MVIEDASGSNCGREYGANVPFAMLFMKDIITSKVAPDESSSSSCLLSMINAVRTAANMDAYEI
jgi:hypothetical protein